MITAETLTDKPTSTARLVATLDACAETACRLDVFERRDSMQHAESTLRSWAAARDLEIEEHPIIGGGWDRTVTVHPRPDCHITAYCARKERVA